MSQPQSQSMDIPKAIVQIGKMTDRDKLNEFVVGDKRQKVRAEYDKRFAQLTERPISPNAGNGAPDLNKPHKDASKPKSDADVQRERDARVIYVEKLDHIEQMRRASERVANFLKEPRIEGFVKELEAEHLRQLEKLPSVTASVFKELAPIANRLKARILSFKNLGGTEGIAGLERELAVFEEKNALFIHDLKGKTIETIRKKVEAERAPKDQADA